MCQSVAFDDGQNFPAWEAETCAELSRRLGGELVRSTAYPDSCDVSGDHCLCPVDLEATATKFGLSVIRDDAGFDVILKTVAERAKGYYLATVAGTADGDVILYWDGEHFWHHGSNQSTEEGDFIWLATQPIDLHALPQK